MNEYFIHGIMSNAYTLLIIYARIDLTPWYIECLYCLLVVEEVLYQFKLNIGKLNRDLLQPSRIRYEVWSFSVRHLISIAYWKGLISKVKLFVVVPQAIGISVRNRKHRLQKIMWYKAINIKLWAHIKSILTMHKKEITEIL